MDFRRTNHYPTSSIVGAGLMGTELNGYQGLQGNTHLKAAWNCWREKGMGPDGLRTRLASAKRRSLKQGQMGPYSLNPKP